MKKREKDIEKEWMRKKAGNRDCSATIDHAIQTNCHNFIQCYILYTISNIRIFFKETKRKTTNIKSSSPNLIDRVPQVIKSRLQVGSFKGVGIQ